MSMPEFPSNGLTLVSLFAGCGGSSLGYRMAGYDVRLAVDWDPKAAATYRANFPGTPFWGGDIADLSELEALRLVGVARGEVDVLDGSPPCQGFSTAGKRRFLDGRNLLFREYVRLLLAFHPRAFIMENVSGLVKGKMKLAFAEMTATLKGAGYRVSCRLLNAWWYGVPQDRRRLIWIGVRANLDLKPSHPVPLVKRPVTLAEACPWIASLRYDPRGNVPGRYYDPSGSPSPTLLSGASVGGLQSYHFTVSCESDPHSPEELAPTRVPERYAISRAYAVTPIGKGSKRYFSLKRLSPDKLSLTLQSSQNKLSMATVMHPYQCRRLTIREAKILSGFPTEFTFPSNYAEAWMQIGNSVPPPMAEAVGRHVAALLGRLTNG